MTQSIFLRPLAALVYLTLSGPLLAAQPPAAETTKPGATETGVDVAAAADVCRNDLKSFDSEMAKDGYWRSSEGNGFGYPIGAYGFGLYGANLDRPGYAGPGYLNARPGYEVRVLNEAANILARRGQQQPCEDVLTATRAIYKRFATDMKAGGAPRAETPDWRVTPRCRSATQTSPSAPTSCSGSKCAARTTWRSAASMISY